MKETHFRPSSPTTAASKIEESRWRQDVERFVQNLHETSVLERSAKPKTVKEHRLSTWRLIKALDWQMHMVGRGLVQCKPISDDTRACPTRPLLSL
eukprot:1495562-Amphidinium_carterae.1